MIITFMIMIITRNFVERPWVLKIITCVTCNLLNYEAEVWPGVVKMRFAKCTCSGAHRCFHTKIPVILHDTSVLIACQNLDQQQRRRFGRFYYLVKLLIRYTHHKAIIFNVCNSIALRNCVQDTFFRNTQYCT